MAKLKGTVIVDGVTYRPGTSPPADVAARITNPRAWDGDPPSAAPAQSDSGPASPPSPAGPEPTTESEPAKAAPRTSSGKRSPSDA